MSEALNFKAGFSLIEILVTLALIGLIIFLFSINLSLNRAGIIKIELEKLYTIAIYLQKKAIIENKRQELYFEKENSYKFNNTIYKLDKSVVFTGINSFKGHKIIFYPDGIISPGAIYLTDRHNNAIYKLTCAIGSINYLRKYKYNKTLSKWIMLN